MAHTCTEKILKLELECLDTIEKKEVIKNEKEKLQPVTKIQKQSKRKISRKLARFNEKTKYNAKYHQELIPIKQIERRLNINLYRIF